MSKCSASYSLVHVNDGSDGKDGEKGENGLDLTSGKILNLDPTFTHGYNSISRYNNASNSNVTVTRIAKPSDAPTKSTHAIEIKTIGPASPGFGGFYFGTPTRANAVFVTKIIAKIPTGYTLSFHSNSYGTGGSVKWLTKRIGTGKWETYMHQVTSGTSGTFSSTNYYALSGSPTPSSSKPLIWYLAFATVYDMSDVDINKSFKLESDIQSYTVDKRSFNNTDVNLKLDIRGHNITTATVTTNPSFTVTKVNNTNFTFMIPYTFNQSLITITAVNGNLTSTIKLKGVILDEKPICFGTEEPRNQRLLEGDSYLKLENGNSIPMRYNGSTWLELKTTDSNSADIMASCLSLALKQKSTIQSTSVLYAYIGQLAAQNAVINSLFAEKIKLQANGVFYTGDYLEDGTILDDGIGVYLDSFGNLKANNAEFKNVIIDIVDYLNNKLFFTKKGQAGKSITLNTSQKTRWNTNELLSLSTYPLTFTLNGVSNKLHYNNNFYYYTGSEMTRATYKAATDLTFKLVLGDFMSVTWTTICVVKVNNVEVANFKNGKTDITKYFNLNKDDVIFIECGKPGTFLSFSVSDEICREYTASNTKHLAVVPKNKAVNWVINTSSFTSVNKLADMSSFYNFVDKSYALSPTCSLYYKGSLISPNAIERVTGGLRLFLTNGETLTVKANSITDNSVYAEGYDELFGTMTVLSEQQGVYIDKYLPASPESYIGSPTNKVKNIYAETINATDIKGRVYFT